MLTHPAWLIAHSKNTHIDPVVRGKWVREKLLAGRVPDVPITVDAQVPEDHQKTLRDRLESIIRHAFCFYMGRNEMLSDSQTLINADKAYLASGGSFKVVIISLLSSDSFIYRKVTT